MIRWAVSGEWTRGAVYDEALLPQTLFARRSGHQDIALIRESDGSLSLTLDGYWQFSSRDEHVFHEVLVDTALCMAPRAESVLVLGGGDGLAVRNALRYPSVRRVVLCEIDPDVLEMTRTVPALVALSENSLKDPRVEVVVGDAGEFLPRTPDRFDVVVCDFPVQTGPEVAPDYTDGFFALLPRVLEDAGVVSVQVSLEPPEFWEVADAVTDVFPWTQPRLVALADDTWADFVLASATPQKPVRDLSPELRFLTAEKMETLVIRNRGPTEGWFT